MSPSKILVIKLRAMGDTALMTAPLWELHRAFPYATLHVLVPGVWAPLLEGFPGVQKIWTYDRRNEKTARARAVARLAYQLRKEKYDCVVNFHASPSSSTIAFATGARVRSVHFHGHNHKNRYSTVVVPGKGILKPIIERDMDTVRALGVHVPAGRQPKINLFQHEIDDAKNYLDRLHLSNPILGIHLGASRPTKNWPIERYVTLAIEWCQKEKGSVFAFAGPAEGPEIQSFLKKLDDFLVQSTSDPVRRAHIRKKIVAANDLSLRQMAGILSQVSVLVTSDSGPKHVAVAVNTPTVTLFGPEHPFEWHPYPLEVHPYLFIDQLACRKDAKPGMPAWCGLATCTIEEHRCMKLIGVDAVLTQCQKVAKRGSAE